MLEVAYTLIAMFGLALFAIGFLVSVLDVVMDSPFDLLMSLFSPRRLALMLKLVNAYIHDNWPDTKLVGCMYYGGILLLVSAGLLYCLDESLR